MAWTSGFFNSINNDRQYTADQISGMFEGLITNGVFASLGNKMVVQPNSGMTIQINTGRGFFNGRWAKNDAPHLLTLAAADVTLNRYCAVCVRVDTNTSARTAEPYLKYSEFATNPVKPAMERSELVQEFCLAYVYIKANATAITAAEIEDTRANTDLCGWVTGLIEQLDSNTLWEQWDADFYAWFDRMKNQLTEDAAGNLQTQVDEVREDTAAALAAAQAAQNTADNAQSAADEAMPKSGGKFTGNVSLEKGINEYFETINGYKFRIGTGTTDDTVYLQAVNSNNQWIADIIKFNASTGKITGGNLMPKSGGTFTGNAIAYSTNRKTACLRNITVCDSTGSNSVSTNRILMYRK